MPTAASKKAQSPSKRIDERIKELDDWRGETLGKLRALIKQAVPDVIEEWKWRGARRSVRLVQLEPRRERPPRHRFPRRRKDRREGV